MNNLTRLEKLLVISKLRAEGWVGCTCDECLLVLAQRILDAQIEKETK